MQAVLCSFPRVFASPSESLHHSLPCGIVGETIVAMLIFLCSNHFMIHPFTSPFSVIAGFSHILHLFIPPSTFLHILWGTDI